ncbi:erythromycin esterase family protein [Flavobacterium terrigena]|uniref:Erythromycin esterase homolog n=1 Tax=Flavobacterium terrigena TaxID=402734 RepID=A0A1H6XPG4_9FLAO|nr:erythromycin esterase family protein [Flavobacterium terrigena]SEJ26445.1 Erythromycin esterase homolog [Flavobacterium terrigena]
MKKTLTLFLLFFHFVVFSQNSIPKSVILSEPPISKDFSFLKEELKDVQVVMLGEISHFDGNVFETKTEIVKYLVENMGFNVIAFESGIYDLWKAQEEIKKGTNCKQVFRNSLFSMWGKRKEFQSFVTFFENNKANLKLFGFDHQITSTNGTVNLSNDLFNYSKQINHNLKLNKEDFALLLESISNSSMFDESDISYQLFSSELNKLKQKLILQKNSEEKFYWTQTVNGLLTLGEDAYTRQNFTSAFNCTAIDNIRDKQMAENLLAYVKQNPEAKIICWGANQHFANNLQSVKAPIIKDFVPMGSYIKIALQDKVYSLAAITAKDSIFLQNKWYSTPINAGSFEDVLKKQFKNNHVFISAKQPKIDKINENRLFSPITFIEGKLSDFHDGYVYFPKATLSTIDEYEDVILEGAQQNDVVKNKKEASINLEIKDRPNETYIEEVVIYSKNTPYQILKKAIGSFDKNYPDKGFSSDLKTNILIKVADTTCVNADILAQQYDLGYVNHEFRNTKKVLQTKWNVNQNFETESFKEYHGLMYNSPIQYAPVLKNNKFKKFLLNIEGTTKINNEEVFVIQFSSPRNHSTYTRRVFLSNYSGYIYINKSDNAIVKIIENWEVTDFPISFREGYTLKNNLVKYTNKEYLNESTITEFVKENKLYFIKNATNVVSGNLYNDKNEKTDYEIATTATWNNFNISSPNVIKTNKEVLLFEVKK